MIRQYAIVLCAALSLMGCLTITTPAPIPTQVPATPTPTLTPTATATLTPAPTPLPTATVFTTDYTTLQADLDAYAADLRATEGIDLGIAFIDLTTGDSVSVRGDERFYSLSTFKAPLIVYYLWLIEQGQLTEDPADEAYIIPMLGRSSNTDTTCMIERVGGLEGFNDWTAAQGMPRETNFIISWQIELCPDTRYLAPPDLRYAEGDTDIGITDPIGIQMCPDVPCDQVFTPDDLAVFYQRLYAGEIISQPNIERFLGWMEKAPDNTFFDDFAETEALPMTVYSKNGFRARDFRIDQNFYHETGIVSTPRGDYVMIIFMQDNPAWPGSDIISQIAARVHAAFEENHPTG